MSARFLPQVRVAAVASFFVLALASIIRGYPEIWSFLSDQRATSAKLSALERREAPGYRSLLPVDAYEAFRARLRRGERYYVQAPPGRFFAGVDRPTASRTFARFYLLPALEVDDPRKADVVLSLASDPHALGVRYTRIERVGGGRYFLARVDHG